MLDVMGTIFTVWVAEEAAVAEQVGQVWDVASSTSFHDGGGEELAQMLFDDGSYNALVVILIYLRFI